LATKTLFCNHIKIKSNKFSSILIKLLEENIKLIAALYKIYFEFITQTLEISSYFYCNREINLAFEIKAHVWT